MSAAAGIFPVPKDVGFSWARTDMGVDIETGPGGVGKPLLAMWDGVVQHIQAMGAFGPSWLSIKWTSGPYAGRSSFIGHSGPALVTPGQRVKAGQPLIKIHGGSYGGPPGHFEIGWANAQGDNTLAAPHYTEGQATKEGQSFRRVLDTLTRNRATSPASAAQIAGKATTTTTDGGVGPLGGLAGGLAGDAVGGAVKDAVDAIASDWLGWVKDNALKALLYAVLIAAGVALAAYGLAKLVGVNDVVRQRTEESVKAVAVVAK
jgi:murein DD-endopeptidase MepM/ murein hydrolase activator NlpD